MKTIECGNIAAEIHYDTTDPKNKGWYAAYLNISGGRSTMIADSQKVGHPDMPRAKSATKKAYSIARRYACKLARRGR